MTKSSARIVRWTLVTVVLVAGIAYGVKLWKARTASENARRLGEVRQGDLEQRVTVSGYVIPQRRLNVQAAFDGYLRRVYVKLGDRVKAGDPLVMVTPSSSGEDDAFPQRAPFAGTVVQVLKNEGEYVEKVGNDPVIMRVDDLSQLFVSSDAPELDVVRLSQGQEVAIKASALPDKKFKGVITDISRAANSQDRWDRGRVEFRLKARILDSDAGLFPGLSVTVEVITQSKKNVLILDQEFVAREQDKFFVTMVDGKKKQIMVGMRNEQSFEITSGLSVGDKIRQVDFLAM